MQQQGGFMVEKKPVSQSVIDQISNQLEPGEVIRWLDNPGAAMLNPAQFRKTLILCTSAQTIFVAIFALMMIKYHPANPVPWILLLVMLPAIITSIPIWRVLLPAIIAAGRTSRVYVITSKRVIVWDSISSRLKQSYLPEDIQTVAAKETGNGAGDIFFNAETDYGPMGKYRKQNAALNCVNNVRQVEELLKEFIRQKKLF